ncbi:MAG TPA: BadF/BadG/BcrA/BcrD ATPase family protein [Terriglobales bacterium]|nr:BadF/BadG/BcrA/BcrD ATPase family protein [Terriglobales bacterium]
MAIDAGSSGTRCIIASLAGNVLGHGLGGPADFLFSEAETVRQSLRQATSDAFQRAGIRHEQIEMVMAGCAGLGPSGEGQPQTEQLLAELIPGAGRVRATGDMVTAFWGALRTPIGVVVSAGLGSVCFGRNVTGETCEVGGWGPLMGDEGSAYDIGLQAVRAVARAADGRNDATVLTDMLLRHFAAIGEVEMELKLQGDAGSRENIASLAVHVSEAAELGDSVALQILRNAAKELAISALTALRHLNLINIPASVSFSGSVFEAGRWIIEPFRRAIRDSSPHSAVEAPLLPPIGGAFRLGLQAVGYPMDEPIIHHLARGLVEAGF